MHKVTLYTKPDCCLCDDALAVIERVRASMDAALELETVDISSDRTLLDAYGERIPVVAVDGVERFEYSVDEARLRTLLSARGRLTVSGPATT